MKFDTILVEKKDGIAKITLNRPEKLNPISAAMEQEILSAIEQFDKDDSVSVIIITGAGRAFSAGRDFKEAKGGRIRQGSLGPGGPWKAIEDTPKPVIAAVNGICYTGGFTLVQSCDIIIASENAVFADTHARLAIGPPGANSIRLAWMLGAPKSKEIFLTCEPFSAREAERIGLVNKVVPANKLEETAYEMAKSIIRNSQPHVRFTKSIINQGMMTSLGTALETAHRKAEAFREKRSTEGIKESEARIKGLKEKKRVG